MRFLVVVCLVISACATTAHTLAYKKAVAARDKAHAVLGKAQEPYGRHADELLELINDVDTGYAEARSYKAKKEWLLVKDELQSFAADWQHMEVLGGPYLEERIKIIFGDLDAIIAHEEMKIVE